MAYVTGFSAGHFLIYFRLNFLSILCRVIYDLAIKDVVWESDLYFN